MRLFSRLPWVVVCSLMIWMPCEGAPQPPVFGFTPFPYDLTPEAEDTTRGLIVPNSNLYALHLDDGIPWQEALTDRPYPNRIQQEWDKWARQLPQDHAIYLGLAPLGKDRKTLAPAKGERDGLPLPEALRGLAFDDPKIKTAYLNYARRAVRQFHPDFLNLGIEAGELAARDGGKNWPRFEALYNHVRGELKKEFPALKIGVSFGLQSLTDRQVAARVKALADNSDYLGLSFYPHLSAFGEKLGAPPLPAGNAAWREPLAWVKTFTNKPIALCETGYSSQGAEIERWDFSFVGSPAAQADYVRDLIDLAHRDGYLFVVWFLVADYDRLYARMAAEPDAEANLMWRNVGFFDANLQPKPAWKVWQSYGGPARMAAPTEAQASSTPTPKMAGPTPGGMVLALQGPGAGFSCGPQDRTLAEGGALRWDMRYRSGEWNWCVKDLTAMDLTRAASLSVKLRSDRAGDLFVKLEEIDGESYFAVLGAGADWAEHEVRLDGLSLDPATRRNGHLDRQHIKQIVFADTQPAGSETVQRAVWIGSVAFK